jgi:hypothetical protein
MLVFTGERREAWLEGRAGAKQLWRSKVPSKMKMFLWHLAKQSLPTNDVRNHRRMEDDDRF